MARPNDTKVHDPTLLLVEAVGDEAETALTNQGVSDAASRVWQPVVPLNYDIGFPRIVYHVNVTRAPGFSNKESQTVQCDAHIKPYDTDAKRLLDIKVRLVERMTDRNNFPNLTGWHLIWHDLQNDTQTNERREDIQDAYGRLVTVEYYLTRT